MAFQHGQGFSRLGQAASKVMHRESPVEGASHTTASAFALASGNNAGFWPAVFGPSWVTAPGYSYDTGIRRKRFIPTMETKYTGLVSTL